jgi:RNA polymerase sporulation-specific sigma factor
VAHIIKKYYAQTTEQEDLISIGTIGLIKGVTTYRPDRGVRLATYASRCIENEVLMYFRSRRKRAGDLSLSDSIDADGEGNSLSILDVLSQEDDLLENVSLQELRRQVTEQWGTLEPRERRSTARATGSAGGPLDAAESRRRCGFSAATSRASKAGVEKCGGR